MPKTKMTQIGRGLRVAVNEKSQTVTLEMDYDSKTFAASGFAKSGANKVIGSTGGFIEIPDTDPPVRLSVNAIMHPSSYGDDK